MKSIELFKDYENAKLVTADEFIASHGEVTVKYSDLGTRCIDGIPICMKRDGAGDLQVTFTPDTHLLAIGATRSGKTSRCGYKRCRLQQLPSQWTASQNKDAHRKCQKA